MNAEHHPHAVAGQRIRETVVPQHPPRNVAPASTSSCAEAANSTAVVLYSATLPTISGKPALGLIQTGSGRQPSANRDEIANAEPAVGSDPMNPVARQCRRGLFRRGAHDGPVAILP
jgi:hypothetical protein